MSVRSGQSITKTFTTRVFATGVATDADSLPTGMLYVNGTADAATVSITNITTGFYKAAVTLPTLAVGDVVDLRINATVSSVTDNAVIWTDTKDIDLSSAGKAPATIAAGDIATDAITAASVKADAVTKIQSGLSTHSAADVWAVATRTLSGTLGSFDALWNKIKAWLGALAGKAADTDTRAEINATTAGATYNETTDSLQAISDAGGGGGDTTVIVNPLSTTINDRVTESTIRAYYKENGWAIGPNAVVDAAGDPVDLTVFPTHRLTIEDQEKVDVLTTTTVTVSGADDNQWTATGTSAVTAAAPAKLRWSLRGIDTGVDILLGHGDVIVTYAASVDEA